MKNILFGIALALFSVLAFTSCETENATLLTDGVWTFQDLSTDSEDNTVVSLISLAEALLTDATMEFQEGGTYILSSPLVQNPTTGDWQLIGDDQLLLDPEGETSSTANIETLTKDRLSYTESMVDGNMETYTVTTTWIR